MEVSILKDSNFKRIISKTKFHFINQELNYLKNNGLISEDQLREITNSYEIKSHLSFVNIMLIIGALLLGLGILTFVASNWRFLGKASKFTIIIVLFCLSNITSYKLSKNYPRTSLSFMYISVLTYGAGIFLVAQIFNYGGEFTNAFLLWSLGILPYVVLFKDKLLFILSDTFLIIYVLGQFNFNKIPFFILILCPVVYYINSKINFGEIAAFFNNSLLIFTILYFLDRYIHNFTVNSIAFFIIGLFMFYFPMKMHKEVFKFQGNIIYSVSGLLLTFPQNWSGFWNNLKILNENSYTYISTVFAISLLIYLLFQTKRKNLVSLIAIFIIIIRYYFDTFYSFMPKSLFFIFGGAILLGFGYYFERVRRIGGGNYED
ncbi:MAG: Protein of unknown function rane [Clostridiaceae bacterium]|jgi:uncharacterized membrane protein|nr:Protein of unknown function rane [Clostridiaceae bacterium]